MAKIYFVRHQAAGVLWEFPFSQEPTNDQIAALAFLCETRHGGTHPKTDEPYWLKAVAVPVLGPEWDPSEVIKEARGRGVRVGGGEGQASAGQFSVEGVGTVTPPK